MRSKDLGIIVQTFNNHRINRRTFIKVGAIASLNMACGSTPPKIAILGGGVSGLSAAYFLEKRGFKTEIFEASYRLGGRMMTYKNVFGDDIYTDVGGEFIDDTHTELLDLAKTLEVEIYNLHTDALDHIVIFIDGKKYNAEQLAIELKPYIAIIEEDLKNLPEDDYHYSSSKNYAYLDKLSVTEYLDQIDMKGWLRKFVEIAITSEYGMEASQQSSLNFLSVLNLPSGKNENFNILGQGHEMYKFKRGAESLISKLKSSINSKINLNTEVVKLSHLKNNKVLVGLNNAGKILTKEFDYVINTIPFTVLKNISIEFEMSQAKKMAIQNLSYANAHKFVLGFNEKTWRKYHAQGYIYSNTLIPSAWEGSQMQPGTVGAYTVFLGGNIAEKIKAMDSAKSVELTLNDLNDIFADIKKQYNHRTLQFIWSDHNYSFGAYSVYKKGQWVQFAGAEAEPCGPMYFAGEHTSVAFQGFMNGAVVSAKNAVNQILKNIAK